MRTLAACLLFWPILANGLSRIPDAPPPSGMWQCSIEAFAVCIWDKRDKPPICTVQDSDAVSPVCLNFRTTPYTSSDCVGSTSSLAWKYTGPDEGVWNFMDDENNKIGIDPRTGEIFFLTYGGWARYIIIEGSCKNIELQETENKAGEQSADKRTKNR
ncbi:hypothetical protein N9985_01785 [Gammaproteobacteria bacterium]|nr:hypothetical protein [Gammaproteobacteria bacterium]